jgi:hypothetical protein
MSIQEYSSNTSEVRISQEPESGRITLFPGRIDLRRAQELTWARSIVESPTMIVPNWQIMGRANPGDAYIKIFGADRPVYRVLVCGPCRDEATRGYDLSSPTLRATRDPSGTVAPNTRGATQGPALLGFSRTSLQTTNHSMHQAQTSCNTKLRIDFNNYRQDQGNDQPCINGNNIRPIDSPFKFGSTYGIEAQQYAGKSHQTHAFLYQTVSGDGSARPNNEVPKVNRLIRRNFGIIDFLSFGADTLPLSPYPRC